MGILQKKLPTHWNYFLAIERDVERLSRYVEFTTENLAAYSLEMARIILASASEADVLLKGICQEHSPDSGAASINAYRDVIKEAFPKFSRFNVRGAPLLHRQGRSDCSSTALVSGGLSPVPDVGAPSGDPAVHAARLPEKLHQRAARFGGGSRVRSGGCGARFAYDNLPL